MQDCARLECTVRTNSIGVREAITYKWIGKSPYIRISWNLLKEIVGIGGWMDKIKIGPYPLLRVSENLAEGYVLYVRADKLGAMRVVFYRLTRWLDIIYRRMIITLAVWGLAEYHEAAVPTWRDIKIGKRKQERCLKSKGL